MPLLFLLQLHKTYGIQISRLSVLFFACLCCIKQVSLVGYLNGSSILQNKVRLFRSVCFQSFRMVHFCLLNKSRCYSCLLHRLLRTLSHGTLHRVHLSASIHSSKECPFLSSPFLYYT